MVVVDPNVFFRLNRFWEEMFKEPKEVALGAEYLPNLLGPAIGALKAYHDDEEDDGELRGETGRDADVAVRLLRGALRGDPAVALLRWEAPEKVGRLEKLLAEDAVDASKALRALRALRTVLSDDLARRALATQLGYGEEADATVLWGAAVVLACRNVGRFQESQMKTLLKRSFARSVPLALLERHANRVRRDGQVSNSLETLEEEILRQAARRDETAGRDAEPAQSDLFSLFGGDRAWRRSAYRLVSLARRLWTEALDARAGGDGSESAGLGDAVARLTEDRAAQSRMAREVVARYAAYALQKRFRTVVAGEGRGTDPILAEASTALERVLGEIGVSNRPELTREDPESFPPTTSRSALALAAALPVALSEAYADGYVSDNAGVVAETSDRLGKRLTEILAEEQGLTGPPDSEGNGVGADPEALCAAWSARRRLHAAAGEILAELNPSLEEYLREPSQEEPTGSAVSEDRFWAVWRRNYAGEAFHSSRVPWDAVTDSRVLDRAVAEATSRFGGARADYLVVFRVEGIRPQGLNWRMADVTFYDPALFDYGEGPELGPATEESADDAPPACHAAVRTTADTPTGAVRSARQHLTAGLDCYSFGLSGNNLRGDFNPRVQVGEYLTNLSEERGGFTFQREVPFQDEQRAADLGLPRMALAYGRLLAKTAGGDPRGLTQLQDRFIRAVHWLREARFDEDPAKRFILYYVGLEHIFARGEGSDAVGRRAPKLNKTWRNIGDRLIFPGMAFRRVHEMVQQDAELRAIADADVRLHKWERDERVLFDPEKVRALLNLIPETSAEPRQSVSALLEDLEALREDTELIGAVVERLRDLQTVKVRLLQMLRNTVVHDALYQDERMRYYAQEAYEILDDALDKMVGEVTSDDPDCQTIDQLIEKYDGQPWAPS